MENLYSPEEINKIICSALCRNYELDLDKINSIDDCKKVLKFLCGLVIKPTSKDVAYKGFEEIERYFKY